MQAVQVNNKEPIFLFNEFAMMPGNTFIRNGDIIIAGPPHSSGTIIQVKRRASIGAINHIYLIQDLPPASDETNGCTMPSYDYPTDSFLTPVRIELLF